MYIQCNPNPLNKNVGDCVVRAIAIATGRSWGRVYDELCEEGRKMCDMPSSDNVWGSYLRRHGFRQFLMPETCPECITVRAFCDRYPEGTYIIGTGHHAVACIDGSYLDSWDSGYTTPAFFWRYEE